MIWEMPSTDISKEWDKDREKRPGTTCHPNNIWLRAIESICSTDIMREFDIWKFDGESR
jgi:hypothetical protein